MARPAAKKGYPVLREAMESLGTAARWTVVGATEEEVGGPMEGLAAMGSVDFATLEAVYAEGVDVFALPCQVAPDGDEDGVPVAMLEAMARGVAIVTTPIRRYPWKSSRMASVAGWCHRAIRRRWRVSCGRFRRTPTNDGGSEWRVEPTCARPDNQPFTLAR